MISVLARAMVYIGLGLIFALLPVRGEELVQALPPGSLTLKDVISLSIRRSPQLMESLADYRLSQLQLDAAYIARNPTVDLTAGILRQSAPKHGLNEEELELTVTQLLWDFGKVRWEAKAAKLAAYQSAEELRTQIEILIQAVASNYVQVKLAEKNARVAKQRLKDRNKYLFLSENLFKAGEIAGYEAVQAESSVLSAQQNIQQKQLTLEQAKAALRVQLRAEPGCLLDLEELAPLTEPKLSLKEGLALAYERRPELVALRYGVESAEANAKAQGRQNLPALYLMAELDDERELQSNVMSKSWEVGIELSWQLFDGGAARNAAKQAEVEADQTRAQLAQSQNQVTSDVVNAHLKLTSLWAQIKTAEEFLKKAEETESIAEKRFQAGYSSGVELLNAQDSAIDARTSLAEAQSDYQLAEIDWRRAISAKFRVALPEAMRKTIDSDKGENP